jgi:HSP20 family protein
MSETKIPVTTVKKAEPARSAWHPIGTLKSEIDRLFEGFGRDFWRAPDFEPFWSGKLSSSFAVDVTEGENAYEITAELPGMDEKNIEVNVVNGGLTIKGEKKDEKEEKNKDYYVSERRYGAFERYFRLPEGVDSDKIEANFRKGVLTVTLPKTAAAQKPAKKIDVKAAA